MEGGVWPHLFGLCLTFAVQSVHGVGTATGELGHKYPQIPTETFHEGAGEMRLGEGLTFSTGVSLRAPTGSNWMRCDLQCQPQLSCSVLLLLPQDLVPSTSSSLVASLACSADNTQLQCTNS